MRYNIYVIRRLSCWRILRYIQTMRLQPTTYNLQPNSGFTLIELIISMAVVSLVAAATIASFRNGEKNQSLASASDLITNAARNAQNFALTSKQIANSTCVLNTILTKDPVSYVIFFTPSQTQQLYGIDKCGTANLIESYSLPPKIQVQSNGYRLNGAAVAALQIKFTPPFATMTASSNTTINQGVFNLFAAGSVIVEVAGGQAKTVVVDGISGRIGE